MEEQEPNMIDLKINPNVTDWGNIYLIKKRKWWQFWKKKEIFIKQDSEPCNIHFVVVPEKRMTEEERTEKFITAIADWMNKHD